MNELHYFAISIVALASTIMLHRYRLLSLSRINVIQVMFMTHIFAQFIPATIFATDGTEIGARFLMHNAAAAFLIVVGAVVADLIFKKENAGFYATPLTEAPQLRRNYSAFFLIFFCGCFAIFIVYVLRAPSIPAYDLLFSSNIDFAEHAAARREVSTMGTIFGIAQRFLMPLLFLLCLIGTQYFRSRSLRTIAWCGLIMALLYQAWPGSKTPVAALFMTAGFLILLRKSEALSQPVKIKNNLSKTSRIKKSKRGNYIKLALFISITILYPVFIYMNKPVGQFGLIFVIEQVFSRIFFKPAENAYASYIYFSSRDFTYFKDISALSYIIGQDFQNLSQTIAVFRGFGNFTNSPPPAIGTFYAQGGATVVMLGVPFASFMFRSYEHLCLRLVKTPLSIALYVLLIYGSFRFSWANFHTLLFTELFFPLTILLLVATNLGKRRHAVIRHNIMPNRSSG